MVLSGMEIYSSYHYELYNLRPMRGLKAFRILTGPGLQWVPLGNSVFIFSFS